MRRFFFLTLLLVLFLVSCGGSGEDKGQDLGNPFESSGGVLVTREEHPEGWGRSDCFVCHPGEEIHRVNRTGEGTLPIEEIRAFVLATGLGGCSLCHGDNGVTE